MSDDKLLDRYICYVKNGRLDRDELTIIDILYRERDETMPSREWVLNHIKENGEK